VVQKDKQVAIMSIYGALISEQVGESAIGLADTRIFAGAPSLAEEMNAEEATDTGMTGEDDESIDEEQFMACYRLAAHSNDALLLASISAMFAAHPQQAWSAVERVCNEKAQQATIATQNGDFVGAAAAIEEHRELALVYSMLIDARLERLSSDA
jgi:hypothetical protein